MSAATVGRSDYSKINQLFDKIRKPFSYSYLVIDTSNNLEIEERSIKNIA